MKIALKVTGVFIGVLVVIFILEFIGLGFFKFFEPKRENIRREVYEQTKSYTHGVIQDLGKYYQEYQNTDNLQEKETIKNVIQIRFAEFDETKISSSKLRQFFTNMRGY